MQYHNQDLIRILGYLRDFSKKTTTQKEMNCFAREDYNYEEQPIEEDLNQISSQAYTQTILKVISSTRKMLETQFEKEKLNLHHLFDRLRLIKPFNTTLLERV